MINYKNALIVRFCFINNTNIMELTIFFNKDYTYAVVWASINPEKYGYKIVDALKSRDYKVVPINPKYDEILWVKTFSSLSSVSDKIDVVDFVTPPSLTLEILKEVVKLGIKKVWFQPWSFNDKCEQFCINNHIQYMKDFCLYAMVK